MAEEKPSNTVLLGDSTITQDGDFDPGDYITLWERHSWEKVYEFMDEIPPLEEDAQYCFRIQLNGDQYKEDLSFGMFMLGAMLLKYQTDDIIMGCATTRSPDSENHFALLRKL